MFIRAPRFEPGENLTAEKLNRMSDAIDERTPTTGTGTNLRSGPGGFNYSAKPGTGSGSRPAPWDLQAGESTDSVILKPGWLRYGTTLSPSTELVTINNVGFEHNPLQNEIMWLQADFDPPGASTVDEVDLTVGAPWPEYPEPYEFDATVPGKLVKFCYPLWMFIDPALVYDAGPPVITWVDYYKSLGHKTFTVGDGIAGIKLIRDDPEYRVVWIPGSRDSGNGSFSYLVDFMPTGRSLTQPIVPPP